MNSTTSIPLKALLRKSGLIALASASVGFLHHQAYGWIPSFLSNWLALRHEEIAAAENLQYFGLTTLGFSGLVAIIVAHGGEPVFSSRLLRQSVGQVLNIGGGFIGLIIGLACSIAIDKGLIAASSGFLLALISTVFVAGIPTLAVALLQFPTMTFKAKWAEPYRKQLSVALGVVVFTTATWGLGANILANHSF